MHAPCGGDAPTLAWREWETVTVIPPVTRPTRYAGTPVLFARPADTPLRLLVLAHTIQGDPALDLLWLLGRDARVAPGKQRRAGDSGRRGGSDARDDRWTERRTARRLSCKSMGGASPSGCS